MNPSELTAHTTAMYWVVMAIFAVTTLIAAAAHYRIMTTDNPTDITYVVRFFTFTFGTIGLTGLPTIEYLQYANPYFGTADGIAAIYLTGTVLSLIYMGITMNILLPHDNTTHDTGPRPTTLD